MARAVRIEYPGAVYHVMARGNRGQDIFRDDADRHTWLETLGEACEKTGWVVHAYVLMSNHRLTAVGERMVGDGASYAGGASAQPDETASWAEARATPAQIAEIGMKGKPYEQTQGHNYRTDPSECSRLAEERLGRPLACLGLKVEKLIALPKGGPEKVALAWWLREGTTVSLRWVSERLEMGHYTRVTKALSQMKRGVGKKHEQLRRKLRRLG